MVVTTELNFDPVFAGRWTRLRSQRQIAQQVAAQPNFRNDGAPDAARVLTRDIGPDRDCPARLFEGLVEQWLSGHWQGVRPECVVIKNGSHARLAAEIHTALGKRVRFIFLVRDPRSVVASKLRTRRPYAPWEVMAWGGSLIAAFRWRSYARNIARARSMGAEVLEVRYEDLIKDSIGVIRAIAQFCGCTVREVAQSPATYQVPPTERGIHALASAEITTSRVSEWTSALAARDRRIVEAMCGTEMTARGYAPTTDERVMKRALICASAIPRSAWLVLTHVVNNVRRSRSRSDERNPS